MEWINVKDRLPIAEPDEQDRRVSDVVLCYTNKDDILCGSLEGYDDNLSWFCVGSEHWNLHKSVTHWMPLPEAPNVK